MKKSIFFPAFFALILANLFVYSCQKENAVTGIPTTNITDNTAVVDRTCCECEFMIESVSDPEPENILIYTTRAAGQCAGNVKLIDLAAGCNTSGNAFQYNTWYEFNCCPELSSNYTINFRTFSMGGSDDGSPCMGAFTYPEVTGTFKIRCMGNSDWRTSPSFDMVDPTTATWATRNFQIKTDTDGCYPSL